MSKEEEEFEKKYAVFESHVKEILSGLEGMRDKINMVIVPPNTDFEIEFLGALGYNIQQSIAAAKILINIDQ